MAAVGTLTIEMAANVARLQRDMDRATKTVGGAMDRIQRSVQGATRAFGLLTAAFASYKAVQGILQQADAMTQLNSRLQLVTRTQEEFVKTQASLISIAQRSYTSLGATVDLYTALARSTREVGVSQNELLRVVETFNKSIIISGGSVQAAEAAITQFNQAMASGVLRGEEFNSISEQAPMIMELLANSLGVTRGALRDMAKEGLLVAELVLPALIEGSQGVDEQFAQMNKTVGQAGQQMKNSFMLFLDELNRGQDITSTFAGAIDAVTSGLDYLTRLLRASQGDLSDYIDTQAESAKFARQQAEALKGQEEAVKSRARALLEQKERDELAKKAADELKKSYDQLLKTLREDIRGSTAALQAEQQGLNNAQEDFLKLVSSPQWSQYTEAQRMLVTDLFKQRIETEKLIEAEKARAKAAEERLKKMLDDEKEFREELAKEDKKAEEDRIKAQEKLYEEHRREIEKIGDQLTDALMRAFESGKGFGQAFKDTLVNMFRTMVLRPVLAPISGAFASAFAPSAIAGTAGGMSGSMGFLGGLAAASGALGTGIAAGFTNALSLNFAGSLQAAGSLIGTGALSGIAAGAGMIAGTLLPIVGAVSLIKSLTGGDGKDPTGMGAFVTTRGVDINRELVAATTGFKISSNVVGDFFDRANEQLKPAVQTIVDGILDRTQDRARAIGLEIALGIDAGLVADPAAKSSFGYASVFLGDQEVENFVNRKLGPDFEQATIKFTEQLQESIAKAVLDAGNIVIPAGQTATAVLERLGSSILAVNSTFDTLGLSMFQTSIAGAEMAASLVDLLGGVENFTQLSTQYYQEFYTEAERVEILTRQLTTQFGELGLELPETREAFRALVEAQDLTTESGRQLFAALMQLSPAFANVTPDMNELIETIDQLGETSNNSANILQERIALEDRYLRLIGNTDELRRRELESVDESNRALLERIFALEDEIQALEDARRAAQEFADQASTAYANAQRRVDEALETVRRSFQAEIDRLKETAQTTDMMFARLQRSVERSSARAEERIRRNYESLNEVLTLQLESSRTARDVAQENISALQSVFDVLKSNIEDLMMDVLPEMTVRQGRLFIAQALTTAQTTGYLPDSQQLSSAISAVRSGLTPEAFGSSFEMRREQLRLVVQLQSLQNLTGTQLSTAELQLKAADEQVALLERQIEDARLQFDTDLQQNRDYYNSILDSAQDQIDAIRGVDNSIVSVADAIEQLQSAVSAERDATAQIEVLQDQLAQAEAQVNALRGVNTSIIDLQLATDLLWTAILDEIQKASELTQANAAEAAANAIQLQSITERLLQAQLELLEAQVSNGDQQVNLLGQIDSGIGSVESAVRGLNSSINSLASATRASTRAATSAATSSNISVPSVVSRFASGGMYAGGLRLVGERGPELEITGPARYMSNATLASMMNNGNNEEIKQMREENKVQMRAMVSLQNRMTKIIEQWNGDGLPTERVEA